MRNITLSFKRLFAAVLCLCGISAYAQDAITVGETSVPVVATEIVNVEDYEKQAYGGLTAEYDAAKLATALGVETLADASLYIVNVTDGVANENTTDGWRNGAGDLCGWGDIKDDVKGYCVKIYEVDAVDDEGQPLFDHWGSIDYLGAHPNKAWTVGETFTALWGFVANDKAALVKVVVTFAVNPDAPAEAPEAELDITKITEVGRTECRTERYSTSGFSTTAMEIYVPDMAEKLGVEKTELASYFANDVYVAYAEREMGYKVDSLQLLTETDGWLMRVAENNEGIAGDLLNEACGAYYSANCSYYIQGMSYSATGDSVSFVVGQYPGNLQVGDSLYCNLYIMNGDKAYVISHSLVIVEQEKLPFNEMTKVGEESYTYTMEPASSYATEAFASFDLAAIAELMGCQADEILLYPRDNDGFSLMAPNTTNSGWWFNKLGYPCDWSNDVDNGSYFYIMPTNEAGDFSSLSVGQYPGMCSNGDTYSTVVYLTDGATAYYQINFTLNIVADPEDQLNWVSVGSRSVTIKQHASYSGYTWSVGASVIKFTDLNELIGTTSPTLYGEAQGENLEEPYSKAYSCDPNPGFYMTDDGKVSKWADSESKWAMSIAQTKSSDEIILQTIYKPGTVVAGNVYKARFYLVNKANGRMVTIKLTYTLVEDDVEESAGGAGEEVGRMAIAFPLEENPETGNEYAKSFDLSVVAEALGCTEDDLEENATFVDVEGTTTPVHPATGLNFDIEGNIVDINPVFGIFYEGGELVVFLDEVQASEITDDFDKTIEICFLYGGKMYVLEVRFLSPELYTGIKTVEQAGQRSNAIFDLSGRRVEKAVKGVYIQNGKKVLK